jgi:4-amino-4-deoxy-L-arabinose transferase-like glycosyltransferase
MTSFAQESQSRRMFLYSMGAVVLIKLLLAWGFPMTSDEAFFYQWGLRPAWGYSDHPPMVGWMLALLSMLGDSPWVLRIVTVLLTPLIGWGIVDVLRRSLSEENQANAWLVGSIYLWMPFSVLFFLVTTDTPLLLFMALSAWFYFRADACTRTRQSLAWYLASATALGLAGLSKYFGALLAIAYFAHVLIYRRDRLWAIVLLATVSLALVSINLVFNAHHGWANVMFNVFNRNEKAGFQLLTVGIFLGMMLYLLLPWLIYFLWRRRSAVSLQLEQVQSLAFALYAVPFGIFLVLSFFREIGLHWVLGFVPMYLVWVAWRLELAQLKICLKWTAIFGGLHALVVLLVAFVPASAWQATKLYDRAVFLKETPLVVQAIKQDMPAQSTLMAIGYSPAAMLAYHSGAYVPVFGVGRHHSRQDDLQIDFRQYAGRPIRIFSYFPLASEEYQKYFQSVQSREIKIGTVRFYVLDGYGFNYEAFRTHVLSDIVQSFHQVPRWLPVLGSPFCERYGFAQCSPAR